MTKRACGLLAVMLVGCTAGRAEPRAPCPFLLEEAALEERELAGWPPYYPPMLVRDVVAVDERAGQSVAIECGFVLHRIDIEKIRLLDVRAARCAEDLRACEQRVAEFTGPPGFWEGWGGRALLIGLGFLAGAGATVGIVHAVN